MLTVKQKIEHLNKLGLNGNLEEIEKMYRGEQGCTRNPEYKKLLELSRKYCIRFTELSTLISTAKTQAERDEYNREKKKF